MELDAKRFTEGAMLDTDICIVGGGPAGLVLASELVDRQCDVILLESGGSRAEPEILALNVGVATGDVYAGLGATRHRQVGGTTHLWNSAARGAIGAKYVPLDAADFRARPALDHSGWPFELSELRADYERAQRICGLGPFAYDAEHWATPGAKPWSGLGPDLVSRVYQFGARDALVAPLRATIARATNVRLCSHATAIALETNASGRRVSAVSVGTPGGPRWRVRAKQFVLAAGAVENARQLLVLHESRGIMGDGTEWVGRGFMEHPRDRAITLRPHSPGAFASAGFYDLHQAADGTWIVGRLAIDDAALESGELLNASATLFPRLSRKAEWLRATLPAFAARWLPQTGHGWSTRRSAARDFDGFSVLLNVEQSPHPENRITLSGKRDSLGVPLPALHWEWRADDHARLERIRELIVRNLESVGVATIDENARPDPNAHHHAGTTRMHDDPRLGVTDRNGRVHAKENLYVAGASTFPTAGFANPVLTIVAMSVRLARHLRDATHCA
jgi:choline dehydrogenase-like flavoprotein